LRKRAALIVLAALLAGPALAQPPMRLRAEDHLEPDGSILGGGAFMASYDLMLRDVLHTAYEPEVALRMVAQPSFIPEYAVGLRRTSQYSRGAPYRIFGVTPTISVWTYQTIAMLKHGEVKVVGDKDQDLQKKEIAKLQSSVPTNPHDLKVTSCETGISDGLGGRIVEVWRKILMPTRYSARYTAGADGANYDFGMMVPGLGPISGHVWSPDRNSSTGTLVALANQMYDICVKNKDANMEQLEKTIAELEHRLQ
jgi:hypothetical protein